MLFSRLLVAVASAVARFIGRLGVAVASAVGRLAVANEFVAIVVVTVAAPVSVVIPVDRGLLGGTRALGQTDDSASDTRAGVGARSLMNVDGATNN